MQAFSEEWAKDNDYPQSRRPRGPGQSIQKNYPDDLAFQQALAEEGITFKAWRERLQNTMLQKLVVRKLVERRKSPPRRIAKLFQ